MNRESVEFDNDTNTYIFKCPHCKAFIVVNVQDLNCQIFRHGANKINLDQLNPHTSKLECDNAVVQGRIFGCGKPFRFKYRADGKHYVEICDYI